MRSSVRTLIRLTAAALILVAAVFLHFNKPNTPSLLLTDRETGRKIASFALMENDTFSITFVHSVNQSPVTDYYRREKDNTFKLYATHFHAFGAGMPEDWPEGAIVETSTDGIHVSNLNITLTDFTYIVGTVSDHTLTIGGQTISLRELCGQNTEVLFTII